MNDFFQAQSFHDGPKPHAALGRTSVPLRFIMQSFDEIPFTAFRPSPAPTQGKSRRTGSKPRASHLAPRT